jgi:predicted dehydrogenase
MTAMKIALLGTGFGQAHAAVYAERSDIDEVLVFGRSPQKLAKINDQFGFTTTTDLDALITDPSVDLVDICLQPSTQPSSCRRGTAGGAAYGASRVAKPILAQRTHDAVRCTRCDSDANSPGRRPDLQSRAMVRNASGRSS